MRSRNARDRLVGIATHALLGSPVGLLSLSEKFEATCPGDSDASRNRHIEMVARGFGLHDVVGRWLGVFVKGRSVLFLKVVYTGVILLWREVGYTSKDSPGKLIVEHQQPIITVPRISDDTVVSMKLRSFKCFAEFLDRDVSTPC